MDSVVLKTEDGRLIEARRIKNSRLEVDTWGLDCPGCGDWGVLFDIPWELDEEDNLTVHRELSCRSTRCDTHFRIKNGEIIET